MKEEEDILSNGIKFMKNQLFYQMLCFFWNRGLNSYGCTVNLIDCVIPVTLMVWFYLKMLTKSSIISLWVKLVGEEIE